jgi:RNA polymerase sigma-70 factor, ECF subfamily
VVTLNHAVAVSKVKGPEAALEMIEPLTQRLSNYFHFYGVRGALLVQLGRRDEARVALTVPSRSPIPPLKPPTFACTWID